jgi:dinuclear metal center YbgI/SA1388 family protein
MKISSLTNFLESWAPLDLQESYDNCGLQVGSPDTEIEKALITIDVTEEVIKEAAENDCGMIISHHPVIFGGIKKLTGRTMVERIVAEAIRHNIALYAIHTNLDNVQTGVNKKFADRLGLQNCKILDPKKGILKKLVVYVPKIQMENGRQAPDVVREAMWEAGAGNIGQYDQCSFNLPGTGTFRPLEGADPAIGEIGKLEHTSEEKIESLYPAYMEKQILSAVRKAHPYEEMAYDIIPMENEDDEVGAGMIGELEKEMDEGSFIAFLKDRMKTACVRHSPLIGRKIKRVAICGGSGSFLLKKAIGQKADAFVTGDFKYHQFFDAEGKILIADIGHYESEQFTAELLHDALRKNFPNFALLISQVNTNPINYA